MQNEVPPLPIVDSDGNKRSSRILTKEFRSDPLTDKINHSQCKSTKFLQSNRKQLKPIGGPYKNSMRARGVPESTKMPNKNSGIGQRIISARMLRVKELQNQLTDAHYHLNELANENKLLRALQKRQDSALKRYEGTHAELPRIINSHHEELKVINVKYKQLKAQHRYTCDLLKEKENEIHSLQSQNKHLLRLSKDQHLEEREKLQMQASDLNHQIQQQHETIQLLNRKLTLESKRLKHQITTEVTKHKETKKKLQETLEKLKNAEIILASKEKQLYNGRLPAFNRKKITSQSLTNLQDNSYTSNFIKPSNNNKDFQYELTKSSLPKLPGSDPDESRITISKPNSTENARSETMTSLEQIKNFRLPKSGHSRRSSISGRSSHERAQELDVKLDYQSNFISKSSCSNSLHNFNDNADTQESEEDEEIKNITQGLVKKTTDAKYHVPNEIMREAGYSFSSNNTDDEDTKEEKLITSTSRSRSLHAKLVNGYISSPNKTEENASSKSKKAEEEIKYHQSIINNRRVCDFIEKNLNTDNGCDDKVVDVVEFEEIEEEIQTNNETDACNINSPKSDIGVKDMKKESNENVLTESKSWTVLQEKKEEQKFDNLVFDFQKIDLKSKSLNSNSSKIIDDNDELIQYFDKNRNTDVEDKQSDGKQFQKINLSKPICNGDLKIEKNDMNKKIDLSNQCQDIKEDQELKPRISERRETASNLPKQNSPSGSQEKVSDKKTSNFNKQKLLAAIKAIDDNENIEYLPKKKSLESTSRSQVTENLYRGLPTHTKKREDIIKDIFGPMKVETKLQSGCSKLH